MSRIADVFARLKERREKALVLFVTAGDPSLGALPGILEALAEGGADVIEVGVPFSDPIADGPVIQASSQRALERGVTFGGVLDAVRGFDAAPVLLMGYYNTLYRRGLAESAGALKDAGVCGTIVSDLIPEEAGDWIRASESAKLDNVFLAAPTSTDGRLRAVAEASSGFVYAVSRTGVTGAASSVPDEVSSLVSRLKGFTSLPVCVGFGISSPAHVASVCSVADGAVVGSWLVDWLAKYWDDGAGRADLVEQVRALKAATPSSA
jgi:tryptophan synthase alpha chain